MKVFFPLNSIKNRGISAFLFESFKYDEKIHNEFQTIFSLSSSPLYLGKNWLVGTVH